MRMMMCIMQQFRYDGRTIIPIIQKRTPIFNWQMSLYRVMCGGVTSQLLPMPWVPDQCTPYLYIATSSRNVVYMVAINCARDYANMQPVTINFPCFILRCFLSLLPPTQVIGPPINAQSVAFGPSVSFEYPNNKVHWTKNRATSKNEFFIFAAQGTIVHGLCQQWCIRFVELNFFVYF